ncbi:MAG: crosslink repair DNA glycosylase YcaQ family protein, partial [Actinomycetota bacterium]
MPTDLSLSQARRIALASQGFADTRPSGRVDRRHLRRALDRMGLIQIDSVNVLVRSQELPLFARLGPHPRSLIPDATAAGELFEYWVHEASHVPTDHHHLHRWQMQSNHKWSRYWTLHERRPGFVEEVLRRLEADGPVASGDLGERVGRKGQWWDWDDAKVALEHLFWKGAVTATRRPNDFARVYDLTERVIPAHVLARPAPGETEARKELLLMA